MSYFPDVDDVKLLLDEAWAEQKDRLMPQLLEAHGPNVTEGLLSSGEIFYRLGFVDGGATYNRMYHSSLNGLMAELVAEGLDTGQPNRLAVLELILDALNRLEEKPNGNSNS